MTPVADRSPGAKLAYMVNPGAEVATALPNRWLGTIHLAMIDQSPPAPESNRLGPTDLRTEAPRCNTIFSLSGSRLRSYAGELSMMARGIREARLGSGFMTVALVATLLFGACTGVLATPIGKILETPRDYDGKTLVIKGTVTNSMNLLIFKYYTVNDGTGDLMVITEAAVPNPGEKVRVKGRVNQAFAFQGHSVVVLQELSD